MSALLVERPGLLSTVQDGGRQGYRHLGVSVSGWMDGWSARLANRLAGNPDGLAVLEITWTGPALRAEGALAIAVAGAAFDLDVGGVRMRSPCVAVLAPGAEIVFGARRRGARAYLAVQGGIDVPEVLGSRATDRRAALGGLEGRRLRRGDRLAAGAPRGDVGDVRVRELDLPGWIGRCELRVLPGPGLDEASARAFTALLEGRYGVAPESDRTGYRLNGTRLPAVSASGVSVPVVPGVVQAPPAGAPLLLMSDCQTTGGYATAAVVVTADLPLAGQLGPGDECRFVSCDLPWADQAADERERALDAIAEAVA